MSRQEAYKLALDMMDDQFTSSEFRIALAENTPITKLDYRSLGFLRNRCDNEGKRSKSWTKKSLTRLVAKENVVSLKTQEEADLQHEAHCIEFLKDRGFKIMQSQYIEV